MINYQNKEEFLKESGRNMRKLILIENFCDLGLRKKRRDQFVEYYYSNGNLDLNLLDALDNFKKLKYAKTNS